MFDSIVIPYLALKYFHMYDDQTTGLDSVPYAGGIFSFWLKVACLAYLYNAVAIPLRASFKGVVYSETTTIYAWLVFDYIFDLIYILDIVLVQTHLSYISNGVLQVKVCSHVISI